MKLVLKYFLAIIIIFSSLFIFFHSAGALSGLDDLNPLDVKGVEGISVVIGNIISAILGVIGAFALLMVVTGGIFMLTAAGNQEKVKKGKDILTWAIIGIMVVIGSYMMVDYIIKGITDGAGGGGGGTTPPEGSTTCSTCADQSGVGAQCAKCSSYLSAGEDCTKSNLEAVLSGFTCSEANAFSDCQDGACCSSNPSFNPVPTCTSTTPPGGTTPPPGGSTTDCTDSGGQCITCDYALGTCYSNPTPCTCDKSAIESFLGGWTCEDVGASTECGAEAACCQ